LVDVADLVEGAVGELDAVVTDRKPGLDGMALAPLFPLVPWFWPLLVAMHPVATKRVMRAILKSTDQQNTI